MKLACLALLLLLSQTAFATDYYVNPSGSDSNSGTSHATAWLTISKVNSVNLNAGDKVRFLGPHSYFGRIVLDANDRGTRTSPIVIHSYGGQGRATINAGSGEALFAYNTAGFRVDGLKFVGSGATVNTANGINIYHDLQNATLSGITLKNLEVTGFGKNGVVIGSLTGTTGGYSNIAITDTEIHHVLNNGFYLWAEWLPLPRSGWPHSNVYIARVKSHHNTGDPRITAGNTGSGILLSGVNGATVELCEAYENGINNTFSAGMIGIWAFDSNNVTIQFSESHHNHTSGGDGGGFDLDGGTTNSVMQYNYSHDNAGAGFLLSQYQGAPPFGNNIVRYNISENDARKNSYGAIMLYDSGGSTTPVGNVEIYNNTVYVSPANALGTPKAFRAMTASTNVAVRNNVFMATSRLPLVSIEAPQTNMLFENNHYYGFGTPVFLWSNAVHRNDRTGNPLMLNPGVGDPFGYQLLPGSPAIDTGMSILNPGTRDIYGNPIPRGLGFDKGAHEKQ